MNSRVEWVRQSCRLLQAITEEFESTSPFEGMTIATGIHLEPKTVALLLALHAGGAHVVATGNLNSTQASAVEYLSLHGVEVVGGQTTDARDHDEFLRQVLSTEPNLILDNGGDLFCRYLENPYAGLLGGTEETTSGRMRLAQFREQLGVPVLVINDSPIKQFAENKHAVGQSVLESFMRITNRVTNGRNVAVFGYGACGKGVASNFRSAASLVSVVEVNPVLRLEASFDGFAVPDRELAISEADVIITVTGAQQVITAADLASFKDDVVLINAGHFPTEIAAHELYADESVKGVHQVTAGIRTLELRDGRRVHVVADGHMVNLAGPQPLGNSIESMDIGFALQARCLEAIARGQVPSSCVVVPVPSSIDERVAQAYLDLR